MSYLLHTFNNISMAINKPDGNSNHGQKILRNCLKLIRHVEEVVKKVLNREYVVKMCDTAWKRLRRIMAMGGMYMLMGIRATTNPNKSDKTNNVIDYSLTPPLDSQKY